MVLSLSLIEKARSVRVSIGTRTEATQVAAALNNTQFLIHAVTSFKP
jgi:hypothetical protein